MASAYGTWRSPLSAADVAAHGIRLSAVTVSGDDIYWIEGRAHEGGRSVIVHRRADGSTRDVTPAGFNARTRVHEYGGTAYAVADATLFFSNFGDQRIYRVGVDRDEPPLPITPAGHWRYADFEIDRRRQRVICVREDHTSAGEPLNTLVSIPVDAHASPSAGIALAEGYDFYSTPRLSPDGDLLLWLAWRHPQMPWDGTELWVADVSRSGGLDNAVRVAGSASESIYQPGWGPDGTLYFVSDRGGWWRLYRSSRVGGSSGSSGSGRWQSHPVLNDSPPDAEFGRPQWVFGSASWAPAGESRLVCTFTRGGRWRLAIADVGTGRWRDVAPHLEPSEWLGASATHAVLVAGSSTMASAVVRVELEGGAVEILRHSSSLQLHPDDISVAEPFAFPSDDGHAYAFYYPPRNRAVTVLPDERPPLMAIAHGGPTAAASATFDPRIQFWTTRGFAVVDVDYRGSAGYGRIYRQALAARWGVVDVADMVNAARHLVGEGKADARRLIVRGGSAGGYTALAAITFRPGVFGAAASYYGISDLEVLEQDTHKFESQYDRSLIGPYPEARDLYRARSPIHFVDRISCPLILFQGLEDRVVPANQSQMMAERLRARGLPVVYLEFEGEQHGFRKAETIVTSLTEELSFYGRVFGFAPA